jgi:hypothetical protein
MHGLIFRTVEAYVSDRFGADTWARVVAFADIELTSFETMLDYDPAYFPRVLYGCARALDRPPETVLEDIGTYLVASQNHASIRRLLRFGGDSFSEFLHSLDDLPDRTRLAIPGLLLPQIDVHEPIPRQFIIACSGPPPGFGYVMVGLLRAMADDYGTLAVLDHKGGRDGAEVIDVALVDIAFGEDRGFALADQGQTT